MKKRTLQHFLFITLVTFAFTSCSSGEDEASSNNQGQTGSNGGTTTETSTIFADSRTNDGTIDFGRQYPNFNIRRKPFRITNQSTVPINVSNITVPSGYNLRDPFEAFTLGAFESQDFSLEFYPTTEGTFSGSVTVTSDADEGTSSFSITGTGAETFLDNDGNEYNIVRIGNQLWTLENYRGTTYVDGTDIPHVSFTDTNLDTTYGKYYQRNAIFYWNTVQDKPVTRNLLDGFFVPTNTDWQTLFNHLNGTNVAGGKMKQAGTTLWQSPNAGATNESGFTALPAGSYGGSQFYNIGTASKFWSYKNIDPEVYDHAYSTILLSGIQDAVFEHDHNSSYYSVRLVQRKIN